MHWAFRNSNLRNIAAKIDGGERLSFDDGVQLYESNDVLLLGKLAAEVNRERNGDTVYFVQNHRITPTNVCAFHCNFCSFRRNADAPDAYVRSVAEIVERAGKSYTEKTYEFHIVGGLVPDLGIEYYAEMVSGLISGKEADKCEESKDGKVLQCCTNGKEMHRRLISEVGCK